MRHQETLTKLGYWLGEPDGHFNEDTRHAVIALQKAAGLTPDGIFGPLTRHAQERGVRPEARSSEGLVVEMMSTVSCFCSCRTGRQVEYVFDTSTGKADGTTPTGRWEISAR